MADVSMDNLIEKETVALSKRVVEAHSQWQFFWHVYSFILFTPTTKTRAHFIPYLKIMGVGLQFSEFHLEVILGHPVVDIIQAS
eukprot:942308-Pelagomonas_calceolata.AAC.2